MASASTLMLFARLIFSLGIVIGLMWVAATVMRKRGVTPGRKAPRTTQIEMVARKPLGRNTAIAVVQIGERALVVGITDHQVTKLGETEIEAIDEITAGTTWTVPQRAAAPSGSATAWKAMLDQMRDRTVRH